MQLYRKNMFHNRRLSSDKKCMCCHRRRFRYRICDGKRSGKKRILCNHGKDDEKSKMFPKKTREDVAYSISKHFTIWFAKQDAARFAAKNARVLSITPGNFETPLGNLEKEEASTYLKFAAVKRNGRPEEIAPLYAAFSGGNGKCGSIWKAGSI
jgi:NAD(P)-dependent dehydrogenase (short-subunit alcohol dehydrogenase family)